MRSASKWVVFLGILYFSWNACASIWYVDQANTSGIEDGTSWDTAFSTLQPAVDAAYTGGGGEVWIADGVYSETRTSYPHGNEGDPAWNTGSVMMREGVHLYGGFTGTETDRDQRDWVTHITTIDGSVARSGNPSYHVIIGANNSILDGLRISGGNASVTGADERARGGGIYVGTYSPNINNCTVQNNTAAWQGGGLYCQQSSASILNSSIVLNNAGDGGGLCNDTSTTILEHCHFSENRASKGGGIWNKSSVVSITDCIFEKNLAQSDTGPISYCYGAGMANDRSSGIISRCIFDQNAVKGRDGSSYGGGLYNVTSTPVVLNCLFVGNVASCSGGWANTLGGAIANERSQATYINCTLVDNIAQSCDATIRGGGIYCENSPSPEIRNCILWGNEPNQIGMWDTVPFVSYSCIESGFFGENNISNNPLFVDPGTGDFHLQSATGHWTQEGWVADAKTSPCIDAGDPGDDYLNEPGPNGSQINMGYHGGTAEASLSVRLHHTISAHAGDNGNIEPADNVLVADGHDQVFYLNPNPGYAIQDVLVDGVSVGPITSYTFQQVSEDHTISATFSLGFAITASAGAGGNISPSGSVLVAPANAAAFHIEADIGYNIADVIVDDVAHGVISDYTFEHVSTEHTIRAVFSACPYMMVNPSTLYCFAHVCENADTLSFQVWNAGIGAVEYATSDNVSWLSCSPENGTSTGEKDTITVTFDTTGLAIGQHAASIIISSETTNSPQVISVILVVLGPVIYVDQDAAGQNNGTCWTDAFNDLQSALAVAKSGDKIWVASGTYRPTRDSNRSISFQLKAGVELLGGFSGGESNQCERDWKVNETVLDGDIGVKGTNLDNSYHVVRGTNNAILDGFTVSNGHASGENDADNGGGMLNVNCAPTVRNCTFLNNTTSGYYGMGGGVYNNGNGTFENCLFKNNLSSGVYCLGGGGIYNHGYAPTIRNCVFSGNGCGGYNAYGAGILNDNASSIIDGCLFENGSCIDGGGIENWEGAAPLIINCVFRNNYAAADGGGIDNDAAGLAGCNPTIMNCTFFNNSGDAITSKMDGAATITNCIVAGGDHIYGTAIISYSCIEGGAIGDTNIDVDPRFVDATGGDFHLLPDSDCIDSGASTDAPQTDISGVLRPQGAGVDMGAYEHFTAVQVPELVGLSQAEAENALVALGLTTGEITLQYNPTVDANLVFAQQPAAGTAVWPDYAVNFSVSLGWSPPAPVITLNGNSTMSVEVYSEFIDPGATAWDETDGNLTWWIVVQGEVNTSHVGDVFTITYNVSNSWGLAAEGVTRTVTIVDTTPPIITLLGDESIVIERGCPYGDPSAQATDNYDGDLSASITTEGLPIDTSVPRDYQITYHLIDSSGNHAVDLTRAVRVVPVWFVSARNVSGEKDGTTWATAFSDIQLAVDAVSSAGGGHIWVAEGTYRSSANSIVTMAQGVALYGGFRGGEICRKERNWIAYPAILDGENLRRCAVGANDSSLDGFVLTNGKSSYGGAMANSAVSPVVSNCIFEHSSAISGGGVYNGSNGCPIYTNCVFRYNSCTDYGAGVQHYRTSAKYVNCLFYGNHASDGGGGVNVETSTCTMMNCTFYGNSPNGSSSARSTFSYINSIFWMNGSSDIVTFGDSFTVQYCNFGSGVSGTGNSYAAPLFVDAANADFRLACASPCRDTGTTTGVPDIDLRLLSRPQGAGIDRGAYEMAPDTESAPEVLKVSRLNDSPATPGIVRFGVIFSEDVSGADATDFLLQPSGSITGESITAITGDGLTFVVTVNTGQGEGTIRLDVLGTTDIQNLCGETLVSGFSSGEVYTICENSCEGEGEIEGTIEGEGQTEGTIEGEGGAEGVVEGQAEGQPDGEGQAEGTIEGEGGAEGVVEGQVEGQPDDEGQAEGIIDGEGGTEGATEGQAEGQPPTAHTADQNGDGVITLTELLRVIQFFNLRAYHCQSGTEDGYAPLTGDTSCAPHDSDYNPQNWVISLTELLRLIQFFNLRGYHACPESGTEDGFCPGLN